MYFNRWFKIIINLLTLNIIPIINDELKNKNMFK